MSLGNVDFYDVSIFDESYGGLIADALTMHAGFANAHVYLRISRARRRGVSNARARDFALGRYGGSPD